MPMILSSPFKSFQIDSLSKRWAAVLLLLFVWGVSFWFQIAPPGDPDFSQLMYWYEDASKAEDMYAFMDTNPITNVLSWDNALYFFSALVYAYFLFLCGHFYFVMYVCDLRKVPLSRAPSIYFSRIWWIILFSICVAVPAMLMFSVLPFFFLYWIPAMYARSGLVFFEKQDSFTATLKSLSKTRGHKLSIFLELTVILMLYLLIIATVNAVLSEGSIGIGLVRSFVVSYFTLVISRNMGKRYHMITILSSLE